MGAFRGQFFMAVYDCGFQSFYGRPLPHPSEVFPLQIACIGSALLLNKEQSYLLRFFYLDMNVISLLFCGFV